MTSDHRYMDAYAQMADGTQKDAESKLKRELTDAEANAIRNAGTLMMLESVAMRIESANSAVDVDTQLEEAVDGFSKRLTDSIDEVRAVLEPKLARPSNAAESELVDSIPNCLVAMLALHNIEDSKSISDVSDIMH